MKMNAITEKPGREHALSDWASVGGYLLTPDIFKYIGQLPPPEEGKEFMIQPAMQLMLDAGLPMYASVLDNGRYFDTGDKLEYLKTVVEFALKRDDIGAELRTFLQAKLVETAEDTEP